MEIDKLANEKTEMQRHYVMVSLLFIIIIVDDDGDDDDGWGKSIPV